MKQYIIYPQKTKTKTKRIPGCCFLVWISIGRLSWYLGKPARVATFGDIGDAFFSFVLLLGKLSNRTEMKHSIRKRRSTCTRPITKGRSVESIPCKTISNNN